MSRPHMIICDGRRPTAFCSQPGLYTEFESYLGLINCLNHASTLIQITSIDSYIRSLGFRGGVR